MPGKAITSGYTLSVNFDHVTYKLGQKDPAAGRIDCSGWVTHLQNNAMTEINDRLGREAFTTAERFSPGFDSAAAIIQKTATRNGIVATGNDVTADILKEGMLIGEDNGPTSFDRGRYKGIDHIVQVVKDPKTGGLMISQSSGSGGGVSLTSVDDYLARKHANGVSLTLVDPWQRVRPELEQNRGAINPAQSTPAHDQLTPGLEKLGFSGAQIDSIANQAYQLGTQHNGQPLRFLVGKDGQTIGIQDAYLPPKAFAICTLLHNGLDSEPGVPSTDTQTATRSNSSILPEPAPLQR